MQTVAETDPGSADAARCEPTDEAVRANTYALVAALLVAPPDTDLLSRVASAGTGEGALGDAWGHLASAARRAAPGPVDDEYHALFIGVGRGQVVPYGSWYLSGFMMDRPLAVLRADLRRLGFERGADVREPEDHLAAVLEVMGLLASDGVDFAVQRDFFERHVDAWAGRFFDDLERASSADFYAAVSRFGRRFIEFERQFLGMLA